MEVDQISLDQPWLTWRSSVKERYLNVTRPSSAPGVLTQGDQLSTQMKMTKLCWIKDLCCFQVFGVPCNVPARYEGEQEQRDHHPGLGLQHCQGHGAVRLQWQVEYSQRTFFLWTIFFGFHFSEWVTFQTSLTCFWVLLTSMTSGVTLRNILPFLCHLWMFPHQRFEGGMLSVIVG